MIYDTKNFTKLYFTHYSYVVIFFFHTDLPKFAFSTCYLWKLVFHLSVFYVFSVNNEFWIWFIFMELQNWCNHYLYKCHLWFCFHFISICKSITFGFDTSQQTFLVFQDVFSVTIFHLPRRVCKKSSKNVFKAFSRRLQEDVLQLCFDDVLKDKNMLRWRRLQYVFTKANAWWYIN